MKRIIVIGDSLAADRPDDGFKTEERWPSLLKDELNSELINLAKGYSTTNVLGKLSKKIKFKKSDCIIIQLGIVDSVPRRFKKWETSIIFKLPNPLKRLVLKVFKSFRKQSTKRSYVSKEKFNNNIDCFLQTIEGCVVFVKILPTTKSFKKLNKKSGVSINNYNEIINQLSIKYSNFHNVEFSTLEAEKCTLSDGYHLNLSGHQLVAKKIIALLNKNI